MKLQSLASALVLAMGPMTAMAVTVNIGTLPTAPSTFSYDYTSHGNFTDIFTFTAPAFASFVSATEDQHLLSFYAANNVTLSLYTANDVLVASGSTGLYSPLSHIPLVAGGSYYFMATGGTNAYGGLMTFSTSGVAAAVPEPRSLALMLAGVAAVVSVSLRRGTGARCRA